MVINESHHTLSETSDTETDSVDDHQSMSPVTSVPVNLLNQEETVDSVVAFPELHEYRKKYAKQFIFAHINVNGFRSKFIELKDILLNGTFDLLAVSETKLDSSFPPSQFHVPNFTLYRADRNSRGGGILCYVLSTIPHRIRNDILSPTSLIEHIILELKVKDKKIFIVSLYRPPNVSTQNLIDALENLCCTCLSENCCLYIMGDLNVDFSNDSHYLIDIMSVYDVKNVVKQPTCFKSKDNPSTIDVIL